MISDLLNASAILYSLFKILTCMSNQTNSIMWIYNVTLRLILIPIQFSGETAKYIHMPNFYLKHVPLPLRAKVLKWAKVRTTWQIQ